MKGAQHKINTVSSVYIPSIQCNCLIVFEACSKFPKCGSQCVL